MRTIKFRAWDKKDKIMIVGIQNWYAFKHMIPMQSLGFGDKNGKEIYEGDILEGECGDLSKIGFGCFCENDTNIHGYYILDIDEEDRGGEEHPGLDPDFAGVLEVVGNIYENPNLLK